MRGRIFAGALCALIIDSAAGATVLGASDVPSNGAESVHEEWRKEVIVLAIAPDGSWGVGIDAFVSRAMTRAITECRRKYQREIGCGYRLTTIRDGWILGLRCGSENIIVADRRLADAERQARHQEDELRRQYLPNMPRCEKTVTVDPQGTVVRSVIQQSGSQQPNGD